MARLTRCTYCRNQTVERPGVLPECEDCRRKHGTYRKKWGELTLEEKVEDLNRRLGHLDSRSALIGRGQSTPDARRFTEETTHQFSLIEGKRPPLQMRGACGPKRRISEGQSMKLGMLHYTQRGPLADGAMCRECVEGSRVKLIRQDGGGRTVLEFTDGTWASCMESLDDLATAYEALIRRAALGPAGWESAPVV